MKANKFKFSKKNSLVFIIAMAAIITIIAFQLSQNNNNDNEANNINSNSVKQLTAQNRAESIKRFHTQFCGLDSKPQSNNYVTEVTLPSECSMPLGIYVDDENEQNKIWFVSTKNGTLYSYNNTKEGGFKEYSIPIWKARDTPTDSSMAWALKKDIQGNLWFTDEKQNSLWKFNPNNNNTTTAGFERFVIPKESETFETSYPVSFDFDSEGNIYFVGIRIPSLWFGNTTQMKNNTSEGIYEIPLPIQSFSAQENTTLSLGSTFVQNNTTVWVSMLSFGNKGQIVGYDTEAKNITKIFSLPSDLTSPVGITDDIEGNLWITDHGTSLFLKLNPNNGEIVKYVTSKTDDRIAGNNISTEDSYTLPYWIQKGDNNTIWFNEHTGNKIARFDPLQNKLVEYWIPSQNKLFGVCGENEVCGVANALQFSASSNNSVWFTEWSENKIGYVKANQQLLPIDIEVDKENVTLRRGDSTEIQVTVNTTNTSSYKDENNLWTMEDSATVKENGSLNGTGLTGQFSEKYFTLDNGEEKKTVSYILIASQGIQPGRYTLMLGSGNDEVTVMKAIDLNIL
jgi:virginiamycin B lyase